MNGRSDTCEQTSVRLQIHREKLKNLMFPQGDDAHELKTNKKPQNSTSPPPHHQNLLVQNNSQVDHSSSSATSAYYGSTITTTRTDPSSSKRAIESPRATISSLLVSNSNINSCPGLTEMAIAEKRQSSSSSSTMLLPPPPSIAGPSSKKCHKLQTMDDINSLPASSPSTPTALKRHSKLNRIVAVDARLSYSQHPHHQYQPDGYKCSRDANGALNYINDNKRSDSSGVSPSKKLKKSVSTSTTTSIQQATVGLLSKQLNRQELRFSERHATNIGYNLFGKLRELHLELQRERQRNKFKFNLWNTSSFLLDKLVARERLNTLILNLYPGNKGFSLAFKFNEHAHSDGSTNPMGVTSASSNFSGNNFNSSNYSRETIFSTDNSNVNSNESSSNLSTCNANGVDAMVSTSANLSVLLHETMRWPYEEDELLACIDNEELPLMFVDLFEKHCPHLFYSGCVIVEVRDYRQSFPVSTDCDKFHVLLRPTNQTLLADVTAITSDGEWTQEEKMKLESQLILATAEPLCLDPNPAVGISRINGQYQRRMFNSAAIRRQAKKFSQVAINRKRKTDQFTHHVGLELFEFVSRYRQKPRLSLNASSGSIRPAASSAATLITTPTTPNSTSLSSRLNSLKRDVIQPIRAPNLQLPDTLQRPPCDEVTVGKYARAFERPRETKDCMPQLVEEYVLETDRGNGRVYHIKLSIFQRPANSEYLGVLYLDRDYKENERNGEACQFSLGTRAHANRYIQQFTEIFTEEGRKKVKIMHLVPGQQPRVTCTTGMWETPQQQLLKSQPDSMPHQPLSNKMAQIPLAPSQQSQQMNLLAYVNHPNTSKQQSQQSLQMVGLHTNKPVTANIVLTTPTIAQQHQQPTLLSNAAGQIKLLSNMGQNQFIGFASSSSPTAPPSSDQQQQQQPQQQTTSPAIQYATIMNCDNNILKNAIGSSHIGIRNGSIVLLQPNHQSQPNMKIQGSKLGGAGQTTQMNVALSQNIVQPVMQTTSNDAGGEVSVLQAQLIGLPMNQQQQPIYSPQQQVTQQQTPQMGNFQLSPPKVPAQPGNVTTTNIHSTNPAINALFTSLITSANQFEQQQAAAAAAANNNKASNNSTIINLLNSAPAAMTHKGPTATTAVTINQGSPSSSAFIIGGSPPPPHFTSSELGSPTDSNMGQSSSLVGGSAMLKSLHRISGGHSPGLSSPSPPQIADQGGGGMVRVTMSALASQLASPPALMTNSPILTTASTGLLPTKQGTSHNPSTNIKLSLSGTATAAFLNGHPHHNRVSSTSSNSSPPLGRRDLFPSIISPGSGDSNNSTASSINVTVANTLCSGAGSSSFSLSMPVLNTLLTSGNPHSSNNNLMSSSSIVVHQQQSQQQQAYTKNSLLELLSSPSSTSQQSSSGVVHLSSSKTNPNSVLIERLTGQTTSMPANSNSSSNNSTINNSNISVGVGPSLTAIAPLASTNGQSTSSCSGNSSVATTATVLLQSHPQYSLNTTIAALSSSGNFSPSSKLIMTSSPSTISSRLQPQQQQQHQQFTTSPHQNQIQMQSIPSAGPLPTRTTPPSLPPRKPQSSQLIQQHKSPMQSPASTIINAASGPGVGAIDAIPGKSKQTTTTLNLQGLTLASLQGAMTTFPRLSNVKVQIPGLPQPISVSFSNNQTAGSNAQPTTGLLVSVPVSGASTGNLLQPQQSQQLPTVTGPAGSHQQSMVLTNNQTGQQSLPFAKLVTNSTLKGMNQQNLQHFVAAAASNVANGNAAPIQLVQMSHPTVTSASAAITTQPQAIITTKRLNASSSVPTGNLVQSQQQPPQSLHQPQQQQHLMRNMNPTTGTATLKLAPAIASQSTTGSCGIYAVNNTTGSPNPILMTTGQHFQLKVQQQQSHQLLTNHQVVQNSNVPNTAAAGISQGNGNLTVAPTTVATAKVTKQK